MDALELFGEEGRGKLREASVRSKHPLIRGCPNGVTHAHVAYHMAKPYEARPGELNHLSTQRKRNQNEIPLVAASERGEAQTRIVTAILGL